jgi:hypothetical protein
MKASPADPPMAIPSAEGPLSTPWGVLNWTQVRELCLPGALIGTLGGVIAGGLVAAGGLYPAIALVVGVALAVPLALVGAAYEVLLATGRFPMGTLGPAALLWFVAFPPIRVAHAALTDLVAGDPVAVPHGWAAFVVYQILVSVPFAIGFWWLHENFAPRWWFHIRDRNPVANHFIRVQLQYADAAEAEREVRRKRKEARRAKRR